MPGDAGGGGLIGFVPQAKGVHFGGRGAPRGAFKTRHRTEATSASSSEGRPWERRSRRPGITGVQSATTRLVVYGWDGSSSVVAIDHSHAHRAATATSTRQRSRGLGIAWTAKTPKIFVEKIHRGAKVRNGIDNSSAFIRTIVIVGACIYLRGLLPAPISCAAAPSLPHNDTRHKTRLTRKC